MRLTFYGAIKEVTGANYLLESGNTKVLIDCGLHQGGAFSEKHNWEPFPYDPKSITAVIVTHAHIDHTGRLPKLVKEGFTGKVYSTPPTKDFANLLLLDSEHILLQEAERLKKPPLYGIRDVEELMSHWEGVPYHKEIKIGPIKITLYNAGHILGSGIVLVEAEGNPSAGSGRIRVAFSGDLGNSPSPIIGSTEKLENIDYCVIESIYGNRLHEKVPKGIVEDTIEDTIRAGGTLMIPAFAMERTQKLLFEINELVENGRVPQIPVFLDSPLAIKLTNVYKTYQDYFNQKTIDMLQGDELLFDFSGLKKTLTKEESMGINNIKPPKVIIAGSGMMQGGRILHHAKRYLSDPSSAMLFVSYQAKNSLGRRIQEGEKSIKIHNEEIPVRCRIVSIEGYSAHADQKQLLEWLYPTRLSLKKVFVVQGEGEGSIALVQKVINNLAVHAEIPEKGKIYEL